MKNARDFRPILYAVIDAAGQKGAGADEVVDRFAPVIVQMVTGSVADVLDAQANFYWEASSLLDPTRQVAESNGEEAMLAVIDAQIRTMREVSTRLRRRAADWRGNDAPDVLGAPAAAATLADSVTALTDEWFDAHPELDRATTSLEFRKGDDGLWKVMGAFQIVRAEGLSAHLLTPQEEEEPCCACCATGTGKCYCHNSGKPKTKWCRCEPCVAARMEGKLGDSA